MFSNLVKKNNVGMQLGAYELISYEHGMMIDKYYNERISRAPFHVKRSIVPNRCKYKNT